MNSANTPSTISGDAIYQKSFFDLSPEEMEFLAQQAVKAELSRKVRERKPITIAIR